MIGTATGSSPSKFGPLFAFTAKSSFFGTIAIDLVDLVRAFDFNDTAAADQIALKIIAGLVGGISYTVGALALGVTGTPFLLGFAAGYTFGQLAFSNFDIISELGTEFYDFLEGLFEEVQLNQSLDAQAVLAESFAFDFSFSPINLLADAFKATLELLDPLVIDLDGDGVNTTSVDGSSVTFDLNNDGAEETVGWFEAEDGILFHDWKSITGETDENGDPVGDGEAQDRSELFATFEELSRHDLNGDGILDARDVAPAPTEDINGDGVIDEQDAQSVTLTGDFDGDGELETIQVGWDQIQVWRDANQNGNVDDSELFFLEDLGIESIDWNAMARDIEDNGNLINLGSTVTFADGTTRIINGVDLARDTINQSYEQEVAIDFLSSI